MVYQITMPNLFVYKTVLLVLVHSAVVNAFKGTVNFKLLHPGR
jgi:hypothetical protein